LYFNGETMCFCSAKIQLFSNIVDSTINYCKKNHTTNKDQGAKPRLTLFFTFHHKRGRFDDLGRICGEVGVKRERSLCGGVGLLLTDDDFAGYHLIGVGMMIADCLQCD
jgi:hypothetical protein